MHKKWCAGKDEQNASRTVLPQGRLAPSFLLLAPLIQSRSLHQSQVLHRRSIILEDAVHGYRRGIQIKDAKRLELRISGIESSYRLITIHLAVADLIEIARVSEVGFTIVGKHPGVDHCCELVRPAPLLRSVPRVLPRLTNTNRLQFPKLGVNAQYRDTRIANTAGMDGGDVSKVHPRSQNLPVRLPRRGVPEQETT